MLLKTIIFSVLAVVIMVMDYRQEQTLSFRNALSAFVAPIQYTVDFPISKYDEWQQQFVNRKKLIHQIHSLERDQLLLQAQVQKLIALESENSELKALLKATPEDSDKITLAQLLAVDSNLAAHEAVIDKGSDNKLYQGQPILDAYGVMGQIIQAGPLTSRMMFLTDRRSAIPVQVARNGTRAIAVGMGAEDALALLNVSETADIREGDVMVSSGLGQRYPIGYPVGQVTHVEKKTRGLFRQVIIKPYAHISQSRQVMLVWPKSSVPSQALHAAIQAMQKDHQKNKRKNHV